jgi:hypothetical protein
MEAQCLSTIQESAADDVLQSSALTQGLSAGPKMDVPSFRIRANSTSRDGTTFGLSWSGPW